MNPPKPLTPHPHPVLWLLVTVFGLMWLTTPLGATAEQVRKLTETVEAQQAQLAQQTKALAGLRRGQQSVSDYTAWMGGRLDAVDCDLYGVYCADPDTRALMHSLRASRSESRSPEPFNHRDTLKASLNWAALAQCESSGNPRAVNPSGKYRGAFQMDAAFWRTYGGLTYAARPDLATYAQQLAVAQRGYSARGRSPWPQCGGRL